MRSDDMYRYIGLTPRKSDCSEKERYLLQADAARAALEHKRRFICEDMGEYWCRRHLVWHIGHRDKRRASRETMLVCIMWFKAWEAGIIYRK